MNVLVIDSDVTSAKLVAVLVAARGLAVSVAHSLAEALPLLATADLVLTELVLADATGIETISHLRAVAARDLPIIAVTTLSGPVTEAGALALGARAYRKKPIDVHTFVSDLLHLLEGTP